MLFKSNLRIIIGSKSEKFKNIEAREEFRFSCKKECEEFFIIILIAFRKFSRLVLFYYCLLVTLFLLCYGYIDYIILKRWSKDGGLHWLYLHITRRIKYKKVVCQSKRK